MDGVAYAIGGSLNWFGAWQAPVSGWLRASAVVRVIYSSSAFTVDPDEGAFSPRHPVQAPRLILSQNPRLEGDFPDR